MLRLKSRTQACPNGFRYTQKETGWKSWEQNPSTLWDFNLLVAEVQKHRKANANLRLNTNATAIADEVDTVNATRMLTMNGADIYIQNVGGGPPPKPLAPVRERLARVVAGANLLIEWLGSGAQPVANDLATRRASICATCPQNGQGDFTRWFTVPASEAIRKQLAIRKDMDLSTMYDAKLGVCNACLCPLKLKVHVPIAEIVQHLDDKAKASLDPRCWIIAESK